MNKQILVVLIVTLFVGVTMAQHTSEVCGHVFDAEGEERLKEYVAMSEAGHIDQRSILRYVPVTFHFVGEDNGNGFLNEENVLLQLDALNAFYADQELIFYIDQFKYTANSTIYNSPSSASAEFQMKQVRDNNALDLFMTRTADTGSPGLTLGYYSPINDWVVIRKDRISGDPFIISHEFGHFFSLPHTFFGWEPEPYDEDIHGNPVSSIFSPGGNRVEMQDQSNCTIAGDFICDTPPDYNFGLNWNGCTPYNAGTMDPNGDVVDPMENNVMGYFFGCDEYEFTDTQKDVILADFLSSRRAYLRTGVVPETDFVTDDVVYNYPIDGEETAAFNLVELDWDDVPSANQYLVIIDRTASFALQPKRYIVDESHLEIDDLNPNLQYYWRVWPFNESRTGAGWSATQNFRTGTSTSVEEIESVENFSIFPNPVASGVATLQISSTEAFDADIEIFNVSGQIIERTVDQFVNRGTWTLEFNTSNFSPGLYIVKVQSQKGILTGKFSVQ